MSEINAQQAQAIGLFMGAGLDAIGRLRISNPQTVFDSKLLFDAQPLYWDDQQISGGGTSSTFNTNQASVTLAVSAVTAGVRARQTFRRFNYQPGKSSLVTLTGILGTPATGITRRIGLFDQNNGIFFESAPTVVRAVIRTFTSGGAVDNGVAQASWNIDKFDGSGPSGITLDFSKEQLFVIDYLWQGVGSVRFGFQVNGVIYYAHRSDHTNTDTLVYMSTPNLPLRYEISNSGTGGVASIQQVCVNVVSEGGVEKTGGTFGIPRTTALVTLNNTAIYPLVAIRLAAGYLGTDVKLLDLSVICTTAADFLWYLVLNPVVVGVALAFSAITNSGVEADVVSTNATTITGGTILATGTWSQSSGPGVVVPEPSDVQLGSSIAGVSDVLVLAASRLTGGAETFFGTVRWRETK